MDPRKRANSKRWPMNGTSRTEQRSMDRTGHQESPAGPSRSIRTEGHNKDQMVGNHQPQEQAWHNPSDVPYQNSVGQQALVGHELMGHELMGHELMGHELMGHELMGHEPIRHQYPSLPGSFDSFVPFVPSTTPSRSDVPLNHLRQPSANAHESLEVYSNSRRPTKFSHGPAPRESTRPYNEAPMSAKSNASKKYWDARFNPEITQFDAPGPPSSGQADLASWQPCQVSPWGHSEPFQTTSFHGPGYAETADRRVGNYDRFLPVNVPHPCTHLGSSGFGGLNPPDKPVGKYDDFFPVSNASHDHLGSSGFGGLNAPDNPKALASPLRYAESKCTRPPPGLFPPAKLFPGGYKKHDATDDNSSAITPTGPVFPFAPTEPAEYTDYEGMFDSSDYDLTPPYASPDEDEENPRAPLSIQFREMVPEDQENPQILSSYQAVVDRFRKFISKPASQCAGCCGTISVGPSEIVSTTKAWAKKPRRVLLGLSCTKRTCSTITCPGCGKPVTDKSTTMSLSISGNYCEMHYCCELGRMFAIWFLACGWDTKTMVDSCKMQQLVDSEVKPKDGGNSVFRRFRKRGNVSLTDNAKAPKLAKATKAKAKAKSMWTSRLRGGMDKGADPDKKANVKKHYVGPMSDGKIMEVPPLMDSDYMYSAKAAKMTGDSEWGLESPGSKHVDTHDMDSARTAKMAESLKVAMNLTHDDTYSVKAAKINPMAKEQMETKVETSKLPQMSVLPPASMYEKHRKASRQVANAKGVGYESYHTGIYRSRHKTRPNVSQNRNGENEQVEEAYFRLLSMLLPSHSNYGGLDITTPDFMSDMLSRSPVLQRAAELLGNDSINDICKQHQLYDALIGFVEALGGHTSVSILVYAERKTFANGGLLLDISFPLSGSEVQPKITPKDTATSIIKLLGRVSKSCQVFLQKAQTKAFGDAVGSEALACCTHTLDVFRRLSAVMVTDFDSSDTWGSSNKPLTFSDYHKENAVGELANEELAKTFAFSTEVRKSLAEVPDKGRMKRLVIEISSLQTSLPEGIFVRHPSSRLDVMNVLIIGPRGTPYEFGFFEFDLWCPLSYPNRVPSVRFKTTAGGRVGFNPNLYPDGKVCLSLLGTWRGEPWDPKTSTILQILISIQSMIFTENPWYNEPGRESMVQQKRQSDAYNRRVRGWTIDYAILPWIKGIHADSKDAKVGDTGNLGLTSHWSHVAQMHFKLVAQELMAASTDALSATKSDALSAKPRPKPPVPSVPSKGINDYPTPLTYLEDLDYDIGPLDSEVNATIGLLAPGDSRVVHLENAVTRLHENLQRQKYLK